MFDGEKRSYAAMAPLLKRVLIADPQPASARLLSDLMRDIARSYCWAATDMPRALKIAETSYPQLIVVEVGDSKFDGLAFTRAAPPQQLELTQGPGHHHYRSCNPGLYPGGT